MENLFENQPRCLECKSPLSGRAGKKFCPPPSTCKNDYHNRKNRKLDSFFSPDDKQLHKNWKVLHEYYEDSKGINYLNIIPLYQKGFNPKFYFGTLTVTETSETIYIVYNYAFSINKSKGVKIFFQDGGFHSF